MIIGILINGILKAIKSNTKSNMPTPKPEPDPKLKPNLHLPQNQTQLDSVSIRRGASVFNILCYSKKNILLNITMEYDNQSWI